MAPWEAQAGGTVVWDQSVRRHLKKPKGTEAKHCQLRGGHTMPVIQETQLTPRRKSHAGNTKRRVQLRKRTVADFVVFIPLFFSLYKTPEEG